MQNRWKSKVLWASLASALIAFLVGSGLIDLNLGNNMTLAVEFIFTALAAFGIINDPTNSKAL
jgi:uncharacterized membrane protein